MIIEYLKYRKITIFLYLFVIVFFPFVQYLNNLSMKSVVYSVEIVSFLFFLCGIFDFRDFVKRNHDLVLKKKEVNIYSANLKKPRNLLEQSYNEIIEELYAKTNEAMGKMEGSYREQIDYYTMWVHQIKTPIAAMRLTLQNSRNVNPDALLLEELFKIEQYVEMVLHYLRIESMSSDLELHKIDLDSVLRETIKKYSTIFIHKKLSLQYEALNRSVLSDEKWCTFLIEQILSNALKYTNTGSIKIYLEEVQVSNSSKGSEDRIRHAKAKDSKSSEQLEEKNDQVKLVIEDSGIGIRKEDIERIFEKGFTGYNGRWDKKASGIGLYLCDKVARKIAHKIEIESELSKGTIVKITFPNSQIKVF
ncbi:sensor histidine kinase [Anaeromicropila herbilytica]|uniref:histidine kinase n=1 Tax=Anaeromicropila herbilytica TaxID=2785025 RepID=A0A7R7IBK5_9FIRM|nr:sensor histidine kinase [Anaeromicropila herbilytica]BCN28866.1 sensor histidine kinase [Anaeromicropila herbilytica]